MYQDIELTIDQGIALISINRPEVLNAIRVQTYQDLIHALNNCELDDDVRVVVMTGTDGKFTAGNDLTDLLPGADMAGVQHGVAGIFDTLSGMTKPLILAQEGVAVGIGANLLLHADMAYAGRSIRYSLPFTKIGVAAEGASSVLLAEAIGAKHASDLLLTGRFFSAQEAEQWGLINQTVDDGTALEKAMETAKSLLANSQAAMQAIKQLSRGDDHQARVNRAVASENAAFFELLNTEETQFRIQQVLKKAR